jgi:hypothetical protein
MKMSEADRRLFEVAKTLPPDVLAAAVSYQADRCMISEAACVQLAAAYYDAAEIARIRRGQSPNLSQ